MPQLSSRTNLAAWTASTVVLVLLVFLCDRYLDAPLAYWVRDHLYVRAEWSDLTSDLPDLLMQVVILATSVSFVVYRLRIARGIHDAVTRLAQLIVWAAPLAYLVKSFLKFVFGRVNTRFWLQEPGMYGFHWFQRRLGCEGFPSGHMVVVVALLAALWRFYPRWRLGCLLVALLLGVALIATDYHFLSDVLAGAFLGVAVETVVFLVLTRVSRQPDLPSC